MPLFAQNVRKRVRAIPHSTNRAIADLIASRGGTLCHPIMPVANRLGSGFVRIDGGQLGKRDGHLTPLPMDQHEHVGGAAVFRRHTSYFDSFSFAERRDDFGSDALGLKGESDFVIEIVIPAHRLLFRRVGVHDGLVVDAVFPDRVFLRFFHGFAARIRRTEVRPICNRRAISDLLTPARYSLRTWLAWSVAVCGRPSCRAGVVIPTTSRPAASGPSEIGLGPATPCGTSKIPNGNENRAEPRVSARLF